MLITCCTGRSVPANTAGSSQGTRARLASTNRHAAGCAADASEILSGLCASALCQKTEQLFGAITQAEVLFLAYQDASGQGLSCWTWVPPCRNTLQRVHSSTYPLFGGRQVRSPQCRTHTVEEKGTKANSGICCSGGEMSCAWGEGVCPGSGPPPGWHQELHMQTSEWEPEAIPLILRLQLLNQQLTLVLHVIPQHCQHVSALSGERPPDFVTVGFAFHDV